MNKLVDGLGYIFSSIHKIAEQIIKYIIILSNCSLCKQSLKLSNNIKS